MKKLCVVLVVLAAACSERKAPEVSAPADVAPVVPKDLCVTLLGTNDIHGTVEPRIHGEPPRSVREGGLPLLSAYVSDVRANATHPVMLLDAGDMYRGSFASDRFEGKPTIDAMNVIGYDAGVLGNHEFDFGTGENGGDKLAVVRQRVADAKFPILTANVYDRATGKRIDWPNTHASLLKRIGEMDIGIIGLSTVDTPATTFASNVDALEFKDPAPIVQAEAADLRKRGARLVILVGHVGTECASADACDPDSELVKLLTTIPRGTVDAAVAGHTHRDVTSWINGVPVIESSSYGRKLGRIDLCAKADGGIDAEKSKINEPTRLCETAWADNTCDDPVDGAVTPHPVQLSGKPVEPDKQVVGVIAPYLEKIAELKGSSVGIHLPKRLLKAGPHESAGAYLAQGLSELAGVPYAVQNLGGVRNDLPPGELTFAAIYDTAPFGNHIAIMKLTHDELVRAMGILAKRKQAPFTAGFEVVMKGDEAKLTLPGGKKPLPKAEFYSVAMPDFLAMGGDGTAEVFKSVPADRMQILHPVDRDALMTALRAKYPSKLLPDRVAK